MKKTLLTLAAAMALVPAIAAPLNVDNAQNIQGTDIEETKKEDGTVQSARHIQPLESFDLGDYKFTFSNTGEGTAPAYYWATSTNKNQQKTVRIYTGNTMTVASANGGKIGTISFKYTNGKTPGFTVSAGTVTDADNTMTWTVAEPVESVTFTATGNLRFSEIEISGEGGTETPPATSGLLDIDFKTADGGFTFEQGTLPEGLSFVWTRDSRYGLKASGYYQKVYATDAWAISPVVDLAEVKAPKMAFNQCINNFKLNNENIAVADALKMISVCVREEGGEWAVLTVPTQPAAMSWDMTDSGEIDLSAYAGKKIQIGFHYTSSDEVAGTWEIGYLKMSGEGGSVNPPVTPPATDDYDIIVNDAAEIDGEFSEEKPAVGDGYPTAAHYQPLTSCVIGDYYFSFSTTSENANQAPALYLPMSTSTTGNKNFRVYNGSTMNIEAPEGKLMTAIAIDGSNADSGLNVTAVPGAFTLDGNKGAWAYEEGANKVSLTFDKKYRMYGFKITIKGSDAVETIEVPAVSVSGNDIIAPEGAVVYSINGYRVNPTGLAAGIYVVRVADKAVKVVVR